MGPRIRLESPKYHHLISKRSSRSSVWQFFGLPADESGKGIAFDGCICKLCQQTVATKGGSTSNMRTHLKVHHKAEYRNMSRPAWNRPIGEKNMDVTHSELNLIEPKIELSLAALDEPTEDGTISNPVHWESQSNDESTENFEVSITEVVSAPSRSATVSSKNKRGREQAAEADSANTDFSNDDNADGFVDFFKSLLPEIKKFSKSQKYRCKMGVLDVVSKIALEDNC